MRYFILLPVLLTACTTKYEGRGCEHYSSLCIGCYSRCKDEKAEHNIENDIQFNNRSITSTATDSDRGD